MQLTGQDIAIDGEVSLALLPKPVLTATGVRLLGRAGMPAPLQLETLEVRLAPGALLTGEIRVERLGLIGPHITVIRQADGGHNWSWAAGVPDETAAQLAFDAVTVERGTLIYQGTDGAQWRVGELNLTARLDSLNGPLTGQGGFVAAGRPLGFELRLGRRGADGGLALPKLTLTLAEDGASIEFRGQLAGAAGDRHLDGRLTLRSRDLSRTARVIGLPGAFPRLPAVVEARLQASGDEAAANDVSIRLADSHLSGAVHVSFGEQPFFDAALTAGRLDLDALLLLTAPQERRPARAEPARGPRPGWSLPSHWRGALDLNVDGLAWRDAVLRQVQISAELAEGRVNVESARALLPGGSSVTLTGAVALGEAEPRFDGRLALESGNLQRLLTWLGFDLGGVATDRLATFSLATALSLTPGLLQARGTAIRLDGTSAEGGLTYRLQGRPSFGLELALDQLDLDHYLPRPAAAASLPLALLQRFDSNLKLTAGRLGWRGRTLKGIALDLGLVQGQLTVREARITDLAGAEIVLHASASGFAATPTYIGDLQLASPDPFALAEALGLNAPASVVLLAPLSADARLEGTGPDLSLQATGRLGESEFTLYGRIADLTSQPELDFGGRLPDVPLRRLAAVFGLSLPAAVPEALAVALEGRLTGGLEPLTLNLSAVVAEANLQVNGSINAAGPAAFDLAVQGSHADAADFLKQVGLAAVGGQTQGGLTLSARLAGDGQTVRLNEVELQLGTNRLAGTIAVSSERPSPRIEGHLGILDLDLAAWLSALSPGKSNDRETGISALLDFINRYEGRLELDAGTLVVGQARLGDVAATFLLERGILDVERFEGRLFDGTVRLGGRIAVGSPGALKIVATLNDADLARVLGALLGSEMLHGRLSLRAELQSLGADLAALAHNLGGNLELAARDGTVAGLDLPALNQAIVEGIAQEDAAGRVQRTLASGQTAVLGARGRWRLGGGALVTDQSLIHLEGGEARLTGELALNTEQLSLRFEIQPDALPQAPAIIVRLTGPATAPQVSFDAAAFSTYLARRAGERVPQPVDRNGP